MRVAVVHSFYRSDQPSGENLVVREQSELLAESGHDVELFARFSDGLVDKPSYRLRAASRTITGIGSNPLGEIRAFRPDIVHVHNLFPNFGSTWLTRLPVPFVATLHNYRPLCANGLLFRDGRVCEDCPDGAAWSGIQHGCYQGSRLATFPLAARNALGLKRNPVFSHASAVVCLSARMREIFIRYGAKREQLHVIPNGKRPTSTQRVDPHNNRWLTAGRLEPAKGISSLLQQWPNEERLDVFGDGPEESLIRQLAGTNIRLFRAVTREYLLARMSHYIGLVFPSESFEAQGVVALEAISSGIPVVAKTGNTVADLVKSSGAGVVYASQKDLPQALERTKSQRDAFGDRGLDYFRNNLTDVGWLERTNSLYQKVLGGP